MTILNTDRIFFDKVFEEWMIDVRAELDPANLIRPFSKSGSITEIVNFLTEEARVITDRYPIVALVSDFKGSLKKCLDWYEVSPTIYIFNETLESYDSTQSYDEIVKPLLMPIMLSLISVIENSEHTSQANELVTPDFNIYKGTVAGQRVQETVDCIELKFTNLRIKTNY